MNKVALLTFRKFQELRGSKTAGMKLKDVYSLEEKL